MIRRDSTDETGSALCWIALRLHRTRRLPPAHQRAKHSGFCLSSATDISNRKTIRGSIKSGGGGGGGGEEEKPNWVLIEKGKVDEGIAPLGAFCRPGAVAEAHCGETHGSLCPKGAVALWAALDFLFLERLLRSLRGCLQLKRRRPHGPVDYTIWKAECKARPYLTDQERNILTYLPCCQPCHIKGRHVLADHYIFFLANLFFFQTWCVNIIII